MASDANYFLKKTLGDDFFESLQKFELWKPGTRTTVDHEEIKTALQIVPRVLMAMLIRELSVMNIGETKEVSIPVATIPALIRVTKHERDVYSGEVEHENKKVVDFKYRSIPGVGLVIMSAFELYDTSALIQEQKPEQEDASKKIQHLIDERLALYDLIGKVVDKKIMEREAISQMFLSKLSDMHRMVRDAAPQPAQSPVVLEVPESVVEKVEATPVKKGSPLKGFLENRKSKPVKKAEFSVQMVKGETVSCPDCGNKLISGDVFTGCVCLGDDMNKKLFIKKSEDGVTVRFGRGWDQENIEMLLEVLRSKRGQK